MDSQRSINDYDLGDLFQLEEQAEMGGGVVADPGRAAGAALGSSGGAVCLSRAFSVNSLTRSSLAAGETTDLISTSSGFCSQGEASMLRISVETRALDCA